MPILTEAQKAILAARLAQPDCAGLSDGAAADLLNAATTIANPTPQGQVPSPAPLDPFALMGLLSSGSLANIEAAGMIGPVDDAIRTKDAAALAGWIRYAAQRGKITAEEATAVASALAAVPAIIPDPNWQATVPGPSWANAWSPGVEFVQPDGWSVIDHLTVAMVHEARS